MKSLSKIKMEKKYQKQNEYSILDLQDAMIGNDEEGYELITNENNIIYFHDNILKLNLICLQRIY
jgi:hypothetical protein